MASASVSHLVLFIASLLIAATVAGTLITGVDRVNHAMADQSLQTSEQLEADITIISDAGSDAVVEDGVVTLLVKNTGTSTLRAQSDGIDILINGTYIPNDAVEVEVLGSDGDTSRWAPHAVVEITLELSLSSGDHRAVVRTAGNEDVFRIYFEDT